MAPSLPRQIALAEKHFRSGNHGFAEKLLREILARAPQHSRANELLAYIAGNRGELDQSFALLKVATAAPGASGEAYYYLGKHLLERAMFEPAVGAYRQALRCNGDFFEGLHDLGVALTGCGEAEAALRVFDQAIHMQPRLAQAWFNKGVALDALKRPDDALHCYDQALTLDPGFGPAWRNRGATLNDLGRYHEALVCHEKDIAFDAGNAQAWSNRGVTLAALKRYPQAVESYEKALALDPQSADAWARAAAAYAEMKDTGKALAYSAQALALKPDLSYLQGDWLHSRLATCQWTPAGNADPDASDIDAAFARLRAAVEARHRVANPFEMLALAATAAQQRICGELYCEDRIATNATAVRGAGRERNNRIRIGYFSPDFRSHAVAFLAAGLFEHHDRTRFETHAFSFCAPGDDPMTRRIKAGVEHFHDVEPLSGAAIAERAQQLNLDIAIDLAGHTLGSRTSIFARRAAPIQVNYLGFPGTMGAPFIDYILADDTVAPAEERDGYTEKVVHLPQCFQINDAQRGIAPAPARAACGLPEEAFVFCCFNGVYKLNPRLFDVWMYLLQQTPNSVLWLVEDSETQLQNLRHWAAARGIAPQRLVFAGRLPYAEHLARYALADLVLDTLPFNGGTTTSDALWGGAPVLTCSGDTFAGRMAASLLKTVGLSELITRNLDDYRAKALQLAQQRGALAALRDKLAANRDTSSLFDTAQCTRHIEAAYLEMWRRLDAGLPPAHLRIAGA